jgi:DNA-directed RNA polymerase specialized sigma24 family protein
LGRRQASAKRGGGQVRISLRAAEGFATPGGDDSADLYRALTELRTADARKADVIELTYLVGLNVEEVADVVGVSIPTVNRDLRFGRLWLKHRLQS